MSALLDMPRVLLSAFDGQPTFRYLFSRNVSGSHAPVRSCALPLHFWRCAELPLHCPEFVLLVALPLFAVFLVAPFRISLANWLLLPLSPPAAQGRTR
eukprot:6212015-Pleurochrysis_carterae.AAC.2